MSEERNLKIKARFHIEIGDYVIGYYDKDHLWMENKDGEGLDIPIDDVENLLDGYFKGNFSVMGE